MQLLTIKRLTGHATYVFGWQRGEKQVVYLLKQPVSVMDFVFLALPLIA